jgi:beta-1,2-mannobiose phosphorylase / 1,2-beta-oligomannan phosphorylase
MVPVIKNGILLSRSSFSFDEMGVLNPAVIRQGNTIHLLYRAVRKGNHSTLGYCVLETPLKVGERAQGAILTPCFDYESHGIEDPRIVFIDGLYYLSYTAYDGLNALGALAISADLKSFDRKGIIVPQFSFEEVKEFLDGKPPINEKYQRYHAHHDSYTRAGNKKLVWDKNLVFFPRRIDGKLTFIHRIKPDIQLASCYELSELTPIFWRDYLTHLEDHIVLSPRYDHESSYIGGGCPPLETTGGWLLIYHSVHDTSNGYVYTASAALLDLNPPHRELARLPYPLIQPEFAWETRGEVNNVIFPTGILLEGDTLYIYYGAADEQIAVASVSLSHLLNELLHQSIHA